MLADIGQKEGHGKPTSEQRRPAEGRLTRKPEANNSSRISVQTAIKNITH